MTDDTKMKHYRRLKVASGFREFRHHIQQDNRDLKRQQSLIDVHIKCHKRLQKNIDFFTDFVQLCS